MHLPHTGITESTGGAWKVFEEGCPGGRYAVGSLQPFRWRKCLLPTPNPERERRLRNACGDLCTCARLVGRKYYSHLKGSGQGADWTGQDSRAEDCSLEEYCVLWACQGKTRSRRAAEWGPWVGEGRPWAIIDFFFFRSFEDKVASREGNLS